MRIYEYKQKVSGFSFFTAKYTNSFYRSGFKAKFLFSTRLEWRLFQWILPQLKQGASKGTVMRHSKSYLQEPYGASRAFSTHAIYSEGNIFPSFCLQTSGFLSAFAEPYLGTLSRPQCFTLRGLRLSNQNHFLESLPIQDGLFSGHSNKVSRCWKYETKL